ncbi:hypothetical protein J2741_001114 [Methanolinea mesophila]|uniref:hypothetical protein n=1 Tax=Methanolinea mesophila TaxID=547055 RepID=UPI001AE5304C|nr:hypothetical protein [Methanolinea mesophila]MBP1928567.1 hypothetical protein [Methanolinea mesophila]
MLDRKERIALALLIAVALTVTVAAVVLEAVGKGPFYSPFTSTAQEGAQVFLEGAVEKVTWTQDGAHLQMVVNGVNVFVPSAAAQGLTIAVGDHAALYGVVQVYRGEKEILVESPGDLKIIRD